MSSAHVTSLAALAGFPGDLALFCAAGREALSANAMEIQRALGWLENQVRFWEKELYNRREELVTAKNNLVQRKLIKFFDRPPDCSEQEKALKRAQMRVREAEEKLTASKRWTPALRRCVEEYDAQARRLGDLLESEIPRATARLEHQIEALEAYVRMLPPSTPISSEPPKQI